MLLTAVSFIVMIGVLIFVHELGHFVAAKAMGIQVHRFSLGFGKAIVSFRWGETEYCIAALPLGGYVKMAGLEEEGMLGEIEGGKAEAPVDPARAFDRKPVWARMIVILAGVTMNFLLAYGLYVGRAVTVGNPMLATTRVDSVDVSHLPTGAEALGALRPGDQILRINGDTVRHWNEVIERLMQGPATARLDVEGREPLVVRLGDGSQRDRGRVAGALDPLLPPRIGVLLPGRSGYRAGLKPGDVIVRANGDTVPSWRILVRTIRSSPGKPLDLAVWRHDSLLNVRVVPDAVPDSSGGAGATYGQIGTDVDPPVRHVREAFGAALADGWDFAWGGVGAVVTGLGQLILGRVSLRESLAGPIEIASVSGQVARLGLDRFLDLLAVLSINLAVLNLLPIPVLDGGQFVFLAAELVRRRPLSLELRLRLTQVGFVFLLGLMTLAILNGVFKYFGH
jgi:regulator of sigma E protease